MAEFKKAMALSEGNIYATVNGKNIHLIEVKEGTAKLEVTKEEYRGLGARMTKSKITGLKGSGDFTSYTYTSRWIELVAEYKKTGIWPTINFTGIAEDKDAGNGRQVITLTGIVFDGIQLLNFSDDSGIMTDEMGYTFNDFNLTESFKETN